jgi:hypothetical protein
MFSSSPSESDEMKNCKLNCQTNYGTPREDGTGAHVPVLIEKKIVGGKRRKLSTFKKGGAKRKASKKRRH